MLAAQKQAYLRDGPPDLGARLSRLKALRGAIIARRSALEDAVMADFGHRPVAETALMEVLPACETIRYLVRHLRRFMAPQRRHVGWAFQAGRARIEYQPLGVVGVIAPWNYPVSLALTPLATAIAAGNRVMLKPSEFTPHTSAALKTLLADVFAQDEVTVVTGGSDVAKAFAALPFDHLLFTGSTQVGRSIMKAASENLVPVTLELGGKSPAIIEPGAVNDRTVSSIAYGKLANAGQTCIAPDYVLVHEDDRLSFVRRYGETVARLFPDGSASRDYAAIINDRHHARLRGLLEDAEDRGATVTRLGPALDESENAGRKLDPYLLLGVDDGMQVMRDEIFGPLLPVVTYRGMEDAIAYVNGRPRPLALYFFGEARGEACRQVRAQTTSGNLGINATLLHFAQEDLPFGGVGESGIGAYHGIEGFRRLSHAKGVYAQGRLNLASLVRPPYGWLARLVLMIKLR
nr:coniferyl aldehyde dehydrogenase [Rhizobium halophytocola]